MSKLSIKQKLVIFVFIAQFFLLGVGGVGYYSLNRSTEVINNLIHVEYPQVILLQRLKASNHAVARFLWTIHGLYSFQAERNNQIAEAKKTFKTLSSEIEELNKIKFGVAETKLVDEINKRWKDISAEIPNVIATYEKGTDEANKEASMALAMNVVPQANEVYDFLNEFDALLQQKIKQESIATEAQSGRLKLIIISSIIGAFIFLIVAGLMFALQLSKNLLAVAKSIDSGAVAIDEAAKKVQSNTDILSEDANVQASAIHSTTSAIEEFNATIRANSEYSEKSVQKSEHNKQMVLESKAVLEKVLAAINSVDVGNEAIGQQVAKNNERLGKIVEIITEINQKTAVINDIVFQVKLLSFNASVEAARAGEHGKGFAVVAEEVGNLASSTSKAAQEISEVINSSVLTVQQITKETAAQIEDMIKKNKANVTTCVSLSENCEQLLNQVVDGSEDINSMIRDISTASREQSKGIADIVEAINKISVVFENTKKLSEDNQSNVNTLYTEMESLNGELKSLDQIVNGT